MLYDFYGIDSFYDNFQLKCYTYNTSWIHPFIISHLENNQYTNVLNTYLHSFIISLELSQTQIMSHLNSNSILNLLQVSSYEHFYFIFMGFVYYLKAN